MIQVLLVSAVGGMVISLMVVAAERYLHTFRVTLLRGVDLVAFMNSPLRIFRLQQCAETRTFVQTAQGRQLVNAGFGAATQRKQ